MSLEKWATMRAIASGNLFAAVISAREVLFPQTKKNCFC
jgi:hypothetical protein